MCITSGCLWLSRVCTVTPSLWPVALAGNVLALAVEGEQGMSDSHAPPSVDEAAASASLDAPGPLMRAVSELPLPTQALPSGDTVSLGPIEKTFYVFCDLSVREKDWPGKPGL